MNSPLDHLPAVVDPPSGFLTVVFVSFKMIRRLINNRRPENESIHSKFVATKVKSSPRNKFVAEKQIRRLQNVSSTHLRRFTKKFVLRQTVHHNEPHVKRFSTNQIRLLNFGLIMLLCWRYVPACSCTTGYSELGKHLEAYVIEHSAAPLALLASRHISHSLYPVVYSHGYIN